MVARQDFLSECNSLNVPVEDFRLSFCDRCVQPACTRSQYGKSLFDQRTQTWVERLFTEVPRMNPSDPRFLPIAGRDFKSIDMSRIPTISTGSQSPWLDPADLDKPTSTDIPEATQSIAEKPSPENKLTEEVVISTLPKNLPHSLLLMNTPPPQKMLLNTPSKEVQAPSLPKKDQWTAPFPLSPEGAQTSDGVVVKRGATIKFSE